MEEGVGRSEEERGVREGDDDIGDVGEADERGGDNEEEGKEEEDGSALRPRENKEGWEERCDREEERDDRIFEDNAFFNLSPPPSPFP